MALPSWKWLSFSGMVALKHWTGGSREPRILNQSKYDKYISVRVMGYDYAKYRSQIDRKRDPLLPVITIVLNFSNRKWKETKSLHSIMSIPNKFRPYTQNYEVKVFDIAFLKDNIIERFTSDFKLIARFF